MERELSYRGAFYPANLEDIKIFIENHLQGVKEEERLKGIIVPHAGWIYSGKTAVKGFSHTPTDSIEDILLLGPSHRVPIHGVAKSTYTAYNSVSTPLELSKELLEEVEKRVHLESSNDAHIYEHSLEVQLEFINYFYPGVKLLPLVVGMNFDSTVEKILELSLNREHTLTIISSDLSHYLPYDVARKKDSSTLDSIIELKAVKGDEACGSVILNGLTNYLTKSNFTIKLIDYTNSGDTAGDSEAVVGYAAMGIYNNG